MPAESPSRLEGFWPVGFSNIQSLKAWHLILQSVTIPPENLTATIDFKGGHDDRAEQNPGS
jgi:hypothetical protein